MYALTGTASTSEKMIDLGCMFLGRTKFLKSRAWVIMQKYETLNNYMSFYLCYMTGKGNVSFKKAKLASDKVFLESTCITQYSMHALTGTTSTFVKTYGSRLHGFGYIEI